MKFATFALALAMACAPHDPAAEVVWRFYNAPGDPPPIIWYAERCLPESPTPACWAGRYEPFGAAEVAGSDSPPSATALAHELMHARQWLRDRVQDPEHLRPEWTEVMKANDALRANNQ